MLRTDIINHFIKKHGYTTYLEVGVSNGWCFERIECENKEGVDPDTLSPAKHCMTSDEFFRNASHDGILLKAYDIIFIDGLHHADQVYKDIKNAIKHLNPGGTIVCHDMSPESLQAQYVPRQVKIWNGDCWKAWVRLRTELDMQMYVINTDFGCGVIREGSQEKLELTEPLTYDNLVKNRRLWLNLKSSILP